MTLLTLDDLITSLYSHKGPALTWYGKDRSELGGPVLARWLAKTANLLNNDLSNTLWNSSEESSNSEPNEPAGTICIDLPPSWQSVFWHISSWLSGWRTVPPPSRHDSDHLISTVKKASTPSLYPDVWIISDVHPSHTMAVNNGTIILAHNLTHLSIEWGKGLPEGISDAISEVSSHGDTLDIPVTPSPHPELIIDSGSSWTLEDIALLDSDTIAENKNNNSLNPLFAFSQTGLLDARIALQHLNNQHLIFIDQRFHTDSEVEKIFQQEIGNRHSSVTEHLRI